MSVQAMTATLGTGLWEALARWWYDLNFRGPGRSTLAADSDWLFFWIFAISTFFFVLLMVLMVVFTVRYRRRPGVMPVRSRSHHTPLELAWSVIPTVILAWMFFHGFRGFTDAVVAPAQAEELTIIGRQWSWAVTYANGATSPLETHDRRLVSEGRGGPEGERGKGVAATPIFVVPEKRPVALRMTSEDVIHSFWIPDFRVKFDVLPNRYTGLWFETTGIDPARAQTARTASGIEYQYEDHWAFCAEYCGANHAEMYAVIRVVPQDAYRQIIAEWATPTGDPVAIGRFLWRSKGCNGCHTIDGTRSVGPSWKNLYGYERAFADGSVRSAGQMTGVEFYNYVRESVYEPGVRIVAGYPNQMQTFQGRVSESELRSLIAFMVSLSDRAPSGGDAAAEQREPTPPGGPPQP